MGIPTSDNDGHRSQYH